MVVLSGGLPSYNMHTFESNASMLSRVFFFSLKSVNFLFLFSIFISNLVLVGVPLSDISTRNENEVPQWKWIASAA